MKKLLTLSATLLLSACACFSSSSEEPEVQVVRQQRTTYVQQEPVVIQNSNYENYVSPRQSRRADRIYYGDTASSNCSGSRYASGNSGCQTQVRETREPVEIVYKNVKHTTVYEPKTYTDVSYQREAYRGAPCGSGCNNNGGTTYRRNVVQTNTVFEEDDYIK